MTTVLTEQGPAELDAAPTPDTDALWLDPAEAERVFGWSLKPEGLCRGEVCIPVPAGSEADYVRDGAVNIAAFFRRIGKPVLASRERDVWLFGESAGDRAAQLESLEAPDFTLPDLHGKPHSLSDYRGSKVFLTTWASW